MRTEEQQALFERSGAQITHNRLVSFLYELMRDHTPPGVVEGLVNSSQKLPCTMTNGWLAAYAEDVAKRLEEPDGEAS
jgi:hypothetical protein